MILQKRGKSKEECEAAFLKSCGPVICTASVPHGPLIKDREGYEGHLLIFYLLSFSLSLLFLSHPTRSCLFPLLFCHPLCCSLAFFPPLHSFIPLTNFWGVYHRWLMWIDGCPWAFATTVVRCALFICHWILIQGLWSGLSTWDCNSLSFYSLKFMIASPVGLFRCLTSKPAWWQSKDKPEKNVYIWNTGLKKHYMWDSAFV